jgi:hypothetical protein
MPVIRTLFALLVCASVGLGAELRTVSGKSYTGQLVAVTDKLVEFSTATGTVKVPVADVLDINLQPLKNFAADTKRMDVELTDGTQLKARIDGLVIKGPKVELTLLSGQTIKLEVKDIAYYLKDAQEPALQEKLRELTKKKIKNDRVLTLQIDDKTKKPDLNPLDGTVGEGDEKGERIKFTNPKGEDRKYLISKIQGIIFYRPEANQVTTLCKLRDTSGNYLVAHKVAVDKTGYKVTTVCGAEVAYETLAVAKLDYNIDKLNFLSDLEPSRVVERAGSGLVIRYRRDKSLDDGPIRVGGKPYGKGLAVHSYTELEYDLNNKYKEFTTFLGVDDQVGGDSKAWVTIECDDTKVFSQEISRKTRDYLEKPLIIKVKDVKTLRIIVSSKNVLDLHDHVTFANPKVSQ